MTGKSDMQIRWIDIPNDWTFNKVAYLVSRLADVGLIEDFILYIDIESFLKLNKDMAALKRYDSKQSHRDAVDYIKFYTNYGVCEIQPTIEKDHCLITSNNIDYRYNITNKIKIYNEDFDKLLNE